MDERQEFLEDNLITITKPSIDAIKNYPNRMDIIALYVFYYYTAKWQKTNQVKCTTGFAAKGLNCSEAKIRKAKKALLELGLVTDVTVKDGKSNLISGHYIKVNYLLRAATQNEIISHTMQIEQCGNMQGVENQDTNAYSTNSLNAYSDNNLNAYSNNKENALIEKPKKNQNKNSFDTMIAEYVKSIDESKREEVAMLLGEWLKGRKKNHKTPTEYAFQQNLKKIEPYAKESNMDITQYLNEIVILGWQGFYPIKTNNGYNAQKGGKANGNNTGTYAEREEPSWASVY